MESFKQQPEMKSVNRCVCDHYILICFWDGNQQVFGKKVTYQVCTYYDGLFI